MKALDKIRYIRPTTLMILSFYSYDLLYPLFSVLVGPDVSELLCLFILLFSVLIGLVHRSRILKFDAVMLYFVCLVLFCLTVIRYPEYRIYIFGEDNSVLKNVFSIRHGIILYALYRIEEDPTLLLGDIKLAAIPVWISYTLRTFSGAGTEEYGYNHAYGFAFLFVCLIFLIFFLREKKITYLVISSIALLQVIMYASRTALLAYLLFLLFYILFVSTTKNNKIKKIIGLVLSAIAVIVFTSKQVLLGIVGLLESIGISSRTLQLFALGSVELDGGRKMMYEQSWEILKNKPLGCGLYWDRYAFPRFHYVHSFLYEVLIDFGWIIGGLLLFLLIIMTIRILRSDSIEFKLLFMMFFSLSMVRLMLSYSFWLEDNFWAMLAIIINFWLLQRSKTQSLRSD